ncbi:MAG: CoA-transferase [bacterium]
MSDAASSKVMSTEEAVHRFVNDGDQLITGNYTEGLPCALIFEIIRQRKRGLTLYSQSGNIDAEFLIAGDCVERMFSTFVHKWGGRIGGSMVERYQRAGKIQVEDYTNFTYNAMLAAGAYGYSCMPVLPAIMDSDVFKKRGFTGDRKFGLITCPFTGKDLPVVPAANPDVCILHVQRADKYGNAQLWGGLGSTVHACLASEKIIVTCEEMVDHEVIRSSPHHTIVPGFRVNAVIEEPFGCHPSELPGFMSTDMVMLGVISRANTTEEGMKKWLEEWVFQLPDRASYMKHYIHVFGQETLNRFRARSYYSAPANYGIGPRSAWEEDGTSRQFGVDMDGLQQLIIEKGMLVDDTSNH